MSRQQKAASRNGRNNATAPSASSTTPQLNSAPPMVIHVDTAPRIRGKTLVVNCVTNIIECAGRPLKPSTVLKLLTDLHAREALVELYGECTEWTLVTAVSEKFALDPALGKLRRITPPRSIPASHVYDSAIHNQIVAFVTKRLKNTQRPAEQVKFMVTTLRACKQLMSQYMGSRYTSCENSGLVFLERFTNDFRFTPTMIDLVDRTPHLPGVPNRHARQQGIKQEIAEQRAVMRYTHLS